MNNQIDLNANISDSKDNTGIITQDIEENRTDEKIDTKNSELKESDQEIKEENIEEEKPKKTSDRDLALKYIEENFDYYMNNDGSIYWGEKGTGIVKQDKKLILDEIINLSVMGRPIRRDHAESAMNLKEIELIKDIEKNRKKRKDILPRLYVKNDIIEEDKKKIKTKTTWIDPNDPTTGFIKINEDTSWSLERKPEKGVIFQRNSVLQPMPVKPAGLETLIDLFNELNIPEDMKIPTLSWVITRIVSPGTACPILLISGEAGSGKTTTARRLKTLLDPSISDTSSITTDEERISLMLGVRSSIVWDNVTSISQKLSDILCRIVTGGAYEARTLYTNQDITTLEYMRSQIITCVDVPPMKEDLRTRTVFIEAPKIKNEYKDEYEINKEWEEKVPYFRGAIITLIAEVIADLKENKELYTANGRLTTYLKTVQSVENVLKNNDIKIGKGDPLNNIKEKNDTLQESSLPDIINFMIDTPEVKELEGSSQRILAHITNIAKEIGYNTSRWGSNGNWMVIVLKENMKILEKYFNIENKKVRRRSYWTIEKKEQEETLDDYMDTIV